MRLPGCIVNQLLAHLPAPHHRHTCPLGTSAGSTASSIPDRRLRPCAAQPPVRRRSSSPSERRFPRSRRFRNEHTGLYYSRSHAPRTLGRRVGQARLRGLTFTRHRILVDHLAIYREHSGAIITLLCFSVSRP